MRNIKIANKTPTIIIPTIKQKVAKAIVKRNKLNSSSVFSGFAD
jgi:hypothetical protein